MPSGKAMSDSNIIDFVEGYFEQRLDPGLAEDLRSKRIRFDKDHLNVAYSAWRHGVTVPPKNTKEFGRHWGLQFEPMRHPPVKQTGQLRPYLPIETQPLPGKPNTGYFVFDRS